MTKYATEQDKIEAWMNKKNEWAKQMISSYPEGTTFTIIVQKSRQMQSNVTRVQRKLKQFLIIIPIVTDMQQNLSTITQRCQGRINEEELLNCHP